ncbi:hypothetical protein GCM10010106_29520 [Thermopolyspora flexuosa]|nr:hypothetical protein GCM10010106_29520 [Thermopolyspora flexuosa]
MRALATGVVAAAALAALTAVPAEAIVMRPPGPNEDCVTGADGTHVGWAQCTNNGRRTIRFRGVIVCGWWPDRYTEWKVLGPGQTGRVRGECGGSGVGGVGIDVRDD